MAVKYWKHIISAIFFVVVFLFWRIGYACAFSYHEQFQMFMFTKGYFAERMSLPGGLADYLSEFLVQFYYFPLFGALIVAVLLLVVQILAYILMRHFGADGLTYCLSYLPTVLLWHYMGNESVLLSFVVAVVASLAFDLAYVNIKNNVAKMLCGTLGVALLYYLFGAVAFASVLFLVVCNCNYKNNVAISVLSVLVAVFAAVVCYKMSDYPLFRFFLGINYFRFPTEIPFMQVLIMIAAALVPFLGIVEEKINKKISVIVAAVMVVFALIFVPSGFNSLNYEVLEYDYLVRIGNWDKIISIAEKNNPRTPQSVSCLNLALAEKGELGNRMFDFFQNGREGLVPGFVRDFLLPLSAAEIYLRLGMVNTSMRNLFEAQEAIPNYRKSGRITKRLAELNIINEDYDVARKYLMMLANTLFYKEFAQSTLAILDGNGKFTDNKFWAQVDKNRYQKDFLYSDAEPDQMYGLLLVQNGKNRLAFDYLMADVLLEKDLQKFVSYYPLGRDAGYNVLPKQFQEALIYAYYQSHGSLGGIPQVVTTPVVNDFQQFMQMYSRDPQSVKTSAFAKSYYAYLLNLK